MDRVIYHGLVVVVLASVLFTSIAMARKVNVYFEPGDYSSYRCSTGNAATTQDFTILTLSSEGAVEVADRLCQSPEMARQVASVTILWCLRSFLTAKHIVEEDFDLFWTRRHLVAGMVPDAGDLYMPVLDTPGYSLYWLSNRPGMRLSQEYFADKRVGFLQDNVSQSFFLQPFRSLREAGIQLDASQKYFYPDMPALFEAFYAGEVNIIPSFEPHLGVERGVNRSNLLMADNVPSGSWFLRKRWLDTGIDCVLATALVLPDLFEDWSLTPVAELNCPVTP